MDKERWTPIAVTAEFPTMHLRTLARRYPSHDPKDHAALVRTAVYELSNQQAHDEISQLTTP